MPDLCFTLGLAPLPFLVSKYEILPTLLFALTPAFFSGSPHPLLLGTPYLKTGQNHSTQERHLSPAKAGKIFMLQCYRLPLQTSLTLEGKTSFRRFLWCFLFLFFFLCIISKISWELSLGKTKGACVSICFCFPRDLSLDSLGWCFFVLFLFLSLLIKLEEDHGWPWLVVGN